MTFVVTEKGEKMEIEYSGIDESLIKWRYNTEPWHTAYITDLIAKWESDKAKENTFVKHMSTVTVRPVVNGEWIYYEEKVPWGNSVTDVTMCKCSVCEYTQDWTSKFCPNCGARMGDNNG